MKKLIPLGVVLVLILIMLVASWKRIGAGYVGIIVDMAGSQKGVQDLPITTGWTFVNPVTQKVYEWPTFVQTAKWTRSVNEGAPTNEEISFNSVEGLVISADISLSYDLDPLKVPAFYVKFRSDDLNQFTHGFLRNIARDAFNEIASRMKVDDIYGAKKTELIEKVKNLVNTQVEMFGVKIEQLGFIGELRLPEAVVNALNLKIAAIQQSAAAQNQIVQAQAEAQQKIARAQGEAQANSLLAKSISPQLIQWRQLDILDKHWDGKYPQYLGGNALLTIPGMK
jgi:regulator of protease activity HflC (stomatin/prohibitin superfamily)